nr:abnormal spindle-like microcephaly-associated protein homolog [Tanacetum cinerariifolium]
MDKEDQPFQSDGLAKNEEEEEQVQVMELDQEEEKWMDLNYETEEDIEDEEEEEEEKEKEKEKDDDVDVDEDVYKNLVLLPRVTSWYDHVTGKTDHGIQFMNVRLSTDCKKYEFDRCPICLKPFTHDKIHQLCCLPCGHMFGMSCLKQWMEDRSRDKNEAMPKTKLVSLLDHNVKYDTITFGVDEACRPVRCTRVVSNLSCGVEISRFTGEDSPDGSSKVFLGGKRDSTGHGGVEVDREWRGPKRRKDELWVHKGEVENKFSSTMYSRLKVSLGDICSLDDMKERMATYLSLTTCKEILDVMTHVTKVKSYVEKGIQWVVIRSNEYISWSAARELFVSLVTGVCSTWLSSHVAKRLDMFQISPTLWDIVLVIYPFGYYGMPLVIKVTFTDKAHKVYHSLPETLIMIRTLGLTYGGI